MARTLIVAGFAATLAACAIAPPRTDDPLQGFNRKMFAFNQAADKAVVRPVAKAYVKVTGPRERVLIGNFFANARTPITIVNDVLEGHPGAALKSTGRFVINTTVGLLGFFDPATDMHLPADPTDFGVTLARWGVPEGPFLVLPLIGPTTLRDVWRLPVDGYFNPLARYAVTHDLKWHAEYIPEAMYPITLRADALPLDPIIDSAYDPYAFVRDAYRQRRLYRNYLGDPPLSAIEQLQGTAPDEQDEQGLDELLRQQQEYEQTHGDGTTPAPAASVPMPPSATSVGAAPASQNGPVPANPEN